MDGALGIFAKLVGFCFTAAMGPGIEGTHCFTEIYDGAHVRDVHVVSKDGAPVYQGETIYSLGPGGLIFTYVNSDGGVGTGTARVDGPRFTYDMAMRAAPEMPERRYRGYWLVRDDGYDAQGEGEPLVRYLPER